jgi:radical SAM superfamily enzyme YgiQ (UPF0313 family)
MKVLLSNPPWFPDEGKRWGIRAGSRWPFTAASGCGYYPYPFLLGYATSYLQSRGIQAWMVDSILTRESMDSYFDRLRHFRFDYVVIETSTPSIDWDLKVARDIHSRGLGKVILTGPHATVFADDLVQHPYVHSVLKGSYEQNLHEALTTGRCGVFDYRHPDDIDSLPFPYRDSTAYRYEDRFPVSPPGPILQLWGSRGCPYRCVFCLWPPVMYQNRYASRSAGSILAEVRDVLGRLPRFTSLYFDDDTFNIGNGRMLEICRGLREIGIPWSAMCRADTTSIEIFEEMRASGCYAVKLGVESGCQELVDRCNKKLDLKTVEKAVQELKRMGMFVHLTFTFGLPGETIDTIKRTRAYYRRLQPNSSQESYCTPFPGTPFFRYLSETEKLGIHEWKQFDGARQSIVTDGGLAAEEIRELGKLRSQIFVWGRLLEQHMGPWLIRAASELGYTARGLDCLAPSQAAVNQLLQASPLDILLVDRGVNLSPDLLSRIKAKKILYYPDILPQPGQTDPHAEVRYAEFKTIAPLFDHVVLHDGASLPFLRAGGHENAVGHVILPFEPGLHRPLGLPKLHDVVFIGTPSPHRQAWLDHIGAKFPVFTPSAWGEEFVRVINQAKIVLNLHFTPLPNTEHRVIEAMACGSFVLTEPLSQHGIFEEGREIVTFCRANVIDLIEHFLDDEITRENIAAAGHEKVVQNYSALSQLRKILQLCGEIED